MKLSKVHCLFEQSGTFKRAFREFGIDAEDYDIRNDFNETNHIVDLFAEIDKAYNGEKSIFDNVAENDLVLAFFPCTRFECQISLSFRGATPQQKEYTDMQKLEYSMRLHSQLHALYMLICKLFVISNRGGWKMIVENPYTQPHYLTSYFPIKPAVIDSDRTKNGDYYKKPTQFWFVNCKPESNIIFEPLQFVQTIAISNAHKHNANVSTQVKRSMIHPQYARRMILSYILDVKNGIYTGKDDVG